MDGAATPLAVYRPGPHFPAITAAALARTAESYDPSLHRAPLVVGHPADGAPSYGWVRSLDFSDGTLSAETEQVAAGLRAAVDEGSYGAVSASFYRPGASTNPVPGVWSLRHVGFLGAQIPRVRGLPAPSFAEGETPADYVTVDFADAAAPRPWTFRSIARLLRGLRDRLIETADQETADRVLPSWDIDQIAEEAERLANAETAPEAHFDEHGDPDMTDTTIELDARQAALDAREAEVKAREDAAAAAADRALAREALDFCERLSAEGRIAPRDRDPLAALLGTLPGDATVDFAQGESGDPAPGPAADFLRDFLGRLPVQIDFAERAPASSDHRRGADAPARIRLPAGTEAGGNAELHAQVLDFAERNGVDYETALTRVLASG